MKKIFIHLHKGGKMERRPLFACVIVSYGAWGYALSIGKFQDPLALALLFVGSILVVNYGKNLFQGKK